MGEEREREEWPGRRGEAALSRPVIVIKSAQNFIISGDANPICVSAENAGGRENVRASSTPRRRIIRTASGIIRISETSERALVKEIRAGDTAIPSYRNSQS